MINSESSEKVKLKHFKKLCSLKPTEENIEQAVYINKQNYLI
jgi:hypothetical protein